MLGRRLGLGAPAAIVAGLVFAFAPTRFFRMGQLHLNTLQWIPFTLAVAHAYLDTGRPASLRVAAAFFTVQALTSGHGALMLAVALCALAIYAVARGAPLAPVDADSAISACPGLLLLLPSVLIVLPYRRVQAELGLDRSIGTTVLSPESFIASPTHVHRWILERVTDHDVNAAATTFLFPGYLVVLLAIAALWPRAKGPGGTTGNTTALDRHVVFYALLAVLSVGFFAGGPLNLWPWVSGWPGFDFIRAPTRFAILMTLALAVLAGAGVERLTARRSPRAAALAATLVGALLLGEYSAHPFSGVAFAMPAPAIVRHVATLPRPFVIAEVPGAADHQGGGVRAVPDRGDAAHGVALAADHPRLQRPAPAAPRAGVPGDEHASRTRPVSPAMRSLGATHVVVHRPEYPPEVWSDLERRLRDIPGVRVVHEEADGLLAGARSRAALTRGQRGRSEPLDGQRHAVAAAQAERGDAALAAAILRARRAAS